MNCSKAVYLDKLIITVPDDAEKGTLDTSNKAKSESQQTIINKMDASQTTLNSQQPIQPTEGQ